MIEDKLQTNYPLAPLSTFKIGGAAEYFITVSEKNDAEDAWFWAKENNLPVTLLGGGSNILVSDQGVKGLVIKLNNTEVKVDATNIICGASANVWDVAQLAVDNNLSGMEWAIGIPGSIGGAVRGNAGAHGGSFDKIVKLVRAFDSEKNEWQEFTNEECGFEYRHSYFKQEPHFIIWQTTLSLTPGNKEVITEAVDNYRKYRQDCQPKEPSAGCIFKNLFISDIEIANKELAEQIKQADKVRGGKVGAGYLIELLKLKGFSSGGAAISEQHANFIVNKNGAKADDVLAIINKVKQDVKKTFNIELKEEVQYLGF
ncbi:MAG: UDP-N-acetylmuramate dehydrogenase [Candidatus Falkowbacteria bacterium]|nr:UDP-N-acetylmuramate dehydrogenase [Candidatus Falkowbacteria bacterium]